MKESNDEILIIGVVFSITIVIFIIVSVIIYYNFIKNGSSSSSSSSSTSSGNIDYNNIPHIDVHQTQLDSRISTALQTESGHFAGMADIIIETNTLKAKGISRVKYINDDNDTVTVKVCGNESGWQPSYHNMTLTCTMGRELFVTSNDPEKVSNPNERDIYCCHYPLQGDPEASDKEGVKDTQLSLIGSFGNTLSEFAADTSTAAIVGKLYIAALILPPVAHMWRGFHATLFKRMGPKGITKLLSWLVRNSLGKIAKGLHAIGMGFIKFATYPFRLLLYAFKNAGIVAVRAIAKGAAKMVSRKAAEEAAETVSERAALTFAELIAEDMEAEGALGVASLLCGPFALICEGVGNVALFIVNIGMMVSIVSTIFDSYDLDGFHQYLDNEKFMLEKRDQFEGTMINSAKSLGNNPPYVFNLGELNIFDKDYSDVLFFKNIYETLKDGLISYQTHIGVFRDGYPLERDIAQMFTSSVGLSSEHDRVWEKRLSDITTTINDKPNERDKFIYNYLKTHLDDSNKKSDGSLKYIMYEPSLSSEGLMSITLNEIGIEKYNAKIVDYIKKNPEESMIPKLVFTKYYRDIISGVPVPPNGTNYELSQNELPKKMAMISYSYDFLSIVCTMGMDKTNFKELPGEASRKDSFGGFMSKEKLLSPKDYGCNGSGQDPCYNIDTGICNFTEGWCTEMGKGLRVSKKLPQGPGGSSAIDYYTCENSEMQEILGVVAGDTASHEFIRHLT